MPIRIRTDLARQRARTRGIAGVLLGVGALAACGGGGIPERFSEPLDTAGMHDSGEEEVDETFDLAEYNPPEPEVDQAGEMSLAEFNEINPGMSYPQVVSVVGSPGGLTGENAIGGYHGEIYTWTGQGTIGANALVQFQDGTVVQKAQSGLR